MPTAKVKLLAGASKDGDVYTALKAPEVSVLVGMDYMDKMDRYGLMIAASENVKFFPCCNAAIFFWVFNAANPETSR